MGLWIIASCYGGGFAICPALVADIFGQTRAPRIYGLALTAWSAAALVSPPLAARMRETYGSYSAVLTVCVVISGFGLLLVLVLEKWRQREKVSSKNLSFKPNPFTDPEPGSWPVQRARITAARSAPFSRKP